MLPEDSEATQMFRPVGEAIVLLGSLGRKECKKVCEGVVRR